MTKSKIQLKLQNIRLIKDLDVKIESGQIIAIQGSNSVGKTSVINSLLGLLEGKNDKGELTHGQDYGGKDMLYTAPNGDSYRVTVEYKEGQSPSMTMIRPDLSKTKKVTDLRSIFNYNHIFPENFMALGDTKPGRQKQADMLVGLMDEQVKVDIGNLKGTIETNYVERRDLGVVIKSQPLPDKPTDTQISLSDNYEDWKQAAKEQVEYYNEAVLDKHSRGARIKLNENQISNAKNRLVEIEEEIALLNKRAEEANKYIKDHQEDLDKTLKDPLPDVDAMKAEVSATQEAIEQARIASEYISMHDVRLANLTVNEGKYNDLTDNIEKDRKQLAQMIAANIPVDNIIINQDNELQYVDSSGEFPFDEKSLSYSKGVLCVAEIILALNKDVPLVCIGKASEIDKKSMKQLQNLARERDCMIVIDKVLQDDEPLSIRILEV